MAVRRTSIRDVARQAGVSATTVSMVLNQSPVPSAATRQKVLSAVKDLDYEPDTKFREAVQLRHAGRQGPRTGTRTVGFLTNELIVENALRDDGYYSRVMAGIQRATEQRRYYLMVKSASLDALMVPAMVQDRRVDGLLIEGEFPEVLRELLVKRLPVAFIDRTYPDLGADSVMPNIERAVREQLAYLWELGHRNIALFQQKARSHHVDLHTRAFFQFFAERNQPVAQPRLCDPRTVAPRTHAVAMAAYAQEFASAQPRPTALITWDVYACTLVDEWHRLGLRVPGDVSVMGMDDILAARLSSPQLSSYRFPMEELGRAAAELLIERIEDRRRPVRHLQINGQIIERASCARPA